MSETRNKNTTNLCVSTTFEPIIVTDPMSIEENVADAKIELLSRKRYACPVHGVIGKRWVTFDFCGKRFEVDEDLISHTKPLCFECIRDWINTQFSDLTEITEEEE